MLCLSPPQRFVIEVKTKGGSKYFIYRRYREFFTLHQNLESKYSPDAERPGPNTCSLPVLPGEACHVSHYWNTCLSEASSYVHRDFNNDLDLLSTWKHNLENSQH